MCLRRTTSVYIFSSDTRRDITITSWLKEIYVMTLNKIFQPGSGRSLEERKELARN